MKGKYYAIIAVILIVILLPITLVTSLGYWLPAVAGFWLPAGTHLSLSGIPRLHRNGLTIPEMSYVAGDCQLARSSQTFIGYQQQWRLAIDQLQLNSACLSQIPPDTSSDGRPGMTVKEWQAMLPLGDITVASLTLLPWPEYSGALRLSLRADQQQLHYDGQHISLAARLENQQLTLEKLSLKASPTRPPFELAGSLTLPLYPDGLPPEGRIDTTLITDQQPEKLALSLIWQENKGQLQVTEPDGIAPLLTLPWHLDEKQLEIDQGQWRWPYAGVPLQGGIALRINDWQQGLDKALVSGRVNVVTRGQAGKGNIVVNIGPGRLSLSDSHLPLHLVGEVKYQQLIFYAGLPAELTGALTDPVLRFLPGALLRSRGRLSEALSIDDVRWPLAGVSLSRQGIQGRLQAIMQARQNKMGEMTLHLDGRAQNFLPDSGLWQWRYWGKGQFTPMQAGWDVSGSGEWRNDTIVLKTLSTGFDQLAYGAMRVSQPRLSLSQPLVWQRDESDRRLRGEILLSSGETSFGGGSHLPPAQLRVELDGQSPADFQFNGELGADTIGPVRLRGRWDSERLRGEAWWPTQSLTVFQPLLPADWKMELKGGTLHAQVAFSAAAGQGFSAGGHGVVSGGSASLPDNQVHGVDFVLPFRYQDSRWHFGTRGPVTLNIAEIRNQFSIKDITASLQGWYPWSEDNPLSLSDVSASLLDGQLLMQQLRIPQHDAALLRLQNLSASQLMAAINPKQFAMSGRFSGALPLWLNHPQWIVKEGWLTNNGPMTFRMDKDLADSIVNNNLAAGAAINWLRYMEIASSWTRVDLDNLGEMTLQSSVTGLSRVEGKSNKIRLNYHHQENLFALWRSLRFGENLQNWLEENAALSPEAAHQ